MEKVVEKSWNLILKIVWKTTLVRTTKVCGSKEAFIQLLRILVVPRGLHWFFNAILKY